MFPCEKVLIEQGLNICLHYSTAAALVEHTNTAQGTGTVDPTFVFIMDEFSGCTPNSSVSQQCKSISLSITCSLSLSLTLLTAVEQL